MIAWAIIGAACFTIGYFVGQAGVRDTLEDAYHRGLVDGRRDPLGAMSRHD